MVDKSRSPEILRLTDLLSSHPGSRLFVPLAEAYLQSDMVDEAIVVLSEGIINHPNFVAARVMLGRIYLKKEQFLEAKNQFEPVLAIAPSNIPSLKGLSEIAQHEGLVSETKAFCQTILKIDPGDKEVSTLLSVLDAASSRADLENGPATPASLEMTEVPFESRTIPDAPDSFPEGEEPVEVSEGGAQPHETRTLAALYLRQGHYQEAVTIYEKLLSANSSDEVCQQGLQEALVRLRENGGSPLSNAKKIERLQSWLDAIQRKRN